MPVPYCHPIDVLRRFDPAISLADIQSGLGPISGIDSAADIHARIQAVSQEWDRETGTALRLRRAGSPGAPSTYEYHDARRQPTRFPLRVELNNDAVLPLDPDAGDVLAVRVGRDDWRDLTDAAGSEWVLLSATGELKLFRRLLRRAFFEAPDDRYLRASYRYGALGGDPDRGGQTALAGALDDSTTTLTVADASRLPADGAVALLPDATDPAAGEYVRIVDVDAGTDELTVVRAARGTDPVAHDSGTPVHYCPPDVRDAVAAQAAAALVNYDTGTQRSDADDLAISPGDKVDGWEAEWEQAKARYSAVRRM